MTAEEAIIVQAQSLLADLESSRQKVDEVIVKINYATELVHHVIETLSATPK